MGGGTMTLQQGLAQARSALATGGWALLPFRLLVSSALPHTGMRNSPEVPATTRKYQPARRAVGDAPSRIRRRSSWVVACAQRAPRTRRGRLCGTFGVAEVGPAIAQSGGRGEGERRP